MRNKKLPLVLKKNAICSDPALQKGDRGARKICVTDLYKSKEFEYSDPRWYGSNEKTPVMVMDNSELAIFTNETVQDRHFHKNGIEIYTVLEGTFVIEVERSTYTLKSGETVIIPKDAVHEVKRESHFTAQVVTVNCGGIEDKYVVD